MPTPRTSTSEKSSKDPYSLQFMWNRQRADPSCVLQQGWEINLGKPTESGVEPVVEARVWGVGHIQNPRHPYEEKSPRAELQKRTTPSLAPGRRVGSGPHSIRKSTCSAKRYSCNRRDSETRAYCGSVSAVRAVTSDSTGLWRSLLGLCLMGSSFNYTSLLKFA